MFQQQQPAPVVYKLAFRCLHLLLHFLRLLRCLKIQSHSLFSKAELHMFPQLYVSELYVPINEISSSRSLPHLPLCIRS